MACCGPAITVITSVCDHNAVLRPLRYLEDQQQIDVTRVSCDPQGLINPADVQQALRQNTRLVALVHASNVTGAIQPIEQVASRLQGHPAHLLVDAAQTVGHLPISVQQLRCDLLAAPGHKGLLGPTGTGFLYLAPGLEQRSSAHPNRRHRHAQRVRSAPGGTCPSGTNAAT